LRAGKSFQHGAHRRLRFNVQYFTHRSSFCTHFRALSTLAKPSKKWHFPVEWNFAPSPNRSCLPQRWKKNCVVLTS
jgi:hypothetical protein